MSASRRSPRLAPASAAGAGHPSAGPSCWPAAASSAACTRSARSPRSTRRCPASAPTTSTSTSARARARWCAALMANGVRPRDLYEILDEERDDPLNFHRGAVYHKGSFASATRNLAQFIWAVGKQRRDRLPARVAGSARAQWRRHAGRLLLAGPARGVSCARRSQAKGLSNSFTGTPRPLLIAAIELDRAERVVFGAGRSDGRADLAGDRGLLGDPGLLRALSDRRTATTWTATSATRATPTWRSTRGATVVVASTRRCRSALTEPAGARRSARGGLYAIMEQVGHITSLNLLDLGLRELKLLQPEMEILRDPARARSPLRWWVPPWASKRVAPPSATATPR